MAYPVLDIANLLLRLSYNTEGAEDMMSNMKLQKMLYYEQGFHLAYFGTPLFDEEIEGWMYGPVVPSVYEHFRENGRNGIMPDMDAENCLTAKEEMDLFVKVYDVYGRYSAFGLMNMTHSEAPWSDLPRKGNGCTISKESMKSFFKTKLTD